MEKWKARKTVMSQSLNMKYYNLQHYIEKLKKGEKFSLARWGDGEMYCMWGSRSTHNANGCRYSPELRRALLDSMHHETDPTFIYGMQEVLTRDRKRIEEEYPNIDWHDSEFLSKAVAKGKLYPFIKQLQKMKIIVISNSDIRPFIFKHFNAYFIEVPKSNAFDHKPEIPIWDNVIYLFSCGMAANVFISELHGKVNSWLIDVGHIWDPFVGNMSRCDLEGKTEEEINRNLQS